MALNDKKIPPNLDLNPVLAAEIGGLKEPDGTVPCAAAIHLAEVKRVKPPEVGRTLDALSVHIGRCQIGTFGYPGHAKGWSSLDAADGTVSPALQEALLEAGGTARRISCLAIWEIAARFKVSRMIAGYAADQAGLKIVDCQLGAF